MCQCPIMRSLYNLNHWKINKVRNNHPWICLVPYLQIRKGERITTKALETWRIRVEAWRSNCWTTDFSFRSSNKALSNRPGRRVLGARVVAAATSREDSRVMERASQLRAYIGEEIGKERDCERHGELPSQALQVWCSHVRHSSRGLTSWGIRKKWAES